MLSESLPKQLSGQPALPHFCQNLLSLRLSTLNISDLPDVSLTAPWKPATKPTEFIRPRKAFQPEMP